MIFSYWFVEYEFPNKDGKPYKSSEGSLKNVKNEKIPIDWSLIDNISEICELVNYGYTQSASEEEVGPKFLRVMDINKTDWINWDSVPYCEIEDKNLDKYLLKKGDIVCARMADPGKVAIFESNIPAVFASYLIRIRLKNPLYGYYLYYFMKSKKYQNYILGAALGSVQRNLNAKGLTTGLSMTVPPEELIKKFNDIISKLRLIILMNNTKPENISYELNESEVEGGTYE